MGMLIWGKVWVLMTWALVLMCVTAEPEYFIQPKSATWDEARNHCQLCFKDLVTVTSNNSHKISQSLNSEHWIGLRKNYDSTNDLTGDFNVSWTQWSNGEPLIFQNWYPNRPVPEYPLPNIDCCDCSCTCPENPASSRMTAFDSVDTRNMSNENASDFLNFWEISNSTTESMTSYDDHTEATALPRTFSARTSTCQKTSMQPKLNNIINKDYIDDPCVAMLSSGLWVEKSCLATLPFVCYEDDFHGPIDVTNVGFERATLTWMEAPGDISSYRVVVNGDGVDLTKNLTGLSLDLINLTAGSRYNVQVFPMKCERELNPQNRFFYTVPHKVENLNVTGHNEKNVSLSWDKPDGNVDFYLVETEGDSAGVEVENERKEVGGLIPGGCYTFTITSGVKDKSRWSEESSIAACTKPGKVSNLNVSDNTENSLVLSWERPEGNFTGFIVTAVSSHDSNEMFKKVTEDVDQVQVTGLPVGHEIHLSVTALANHNIEGESVATVNHTVPGPVSNLTLVMGYSSLSATWNVSSGRYSYFVLELLLDGANRQTGNTTETSFTFSGLKTAAYYTVVVSAVSGHLKGQSVNNSDYTSPKPPTDVKVRGATANSITFEWTHPENIGTANYSVKLESTFRNRSWSDTVLNQTWYTFNNLTSGTNYSFNIFTFAGEKESEGVNWKHSTVSEKREIFLSMMCSNQKLLECDKSSTKKSIFQKLQEHFQKELGNNVVWELNGVERDINKLQISS